MDRRLQAHSATQRRVVPLRGRAGPAGVLLDEAIALWHLVSLVYDGHPRVAEPHIHGIDATGHVALSAYQVRGGSSSGDAQGWKHFRLDKAQELHVLDQTFAGPRPDYNPRDKSFVHVYSQL